MLFIYYSTEASLHTKLLPGFSEEKAQRKLEIWNISQFYLSFSRRNAYPLFQTILLQLNVIYKL